MASGTIKRPYAPGNKNLFDTITDISTDTTITLSEDASHFNILAFRLSTSPTNANNTRSALIVARFTLSLSPYLVIPNISNNSAGIIRIQIVNGNQIHFVSTSISPLYLVGVYGVS